MSKNRRKRKPGAGTENGKNVLIQRIAQTWNARDSRWVGLCRNVLRHPDAMEILTRALMRINPDEMQEVSKSLFRLATHQRRVMLHEDGAHRVNEISLFAVVATGPADSIRKITTCNGFVEITKLIRGLGLVRDNGTIQLISVPVMPEDAADTLMHPELATVSNLILMDSTARKAHYSDYFVRSEVSPDTVLGKQPVTRIFVGGRRLMHRSDTDNVDIFSVSPDCFLPMSKVEPNVNKEWLTAKESFAKQAHDIAQRWDAPGLSFTLSPDWVDGLGLMALDILRNGMEREAILSGVGTARGAQAHAMFGEDELSFAAKKGDVCLGPVQVPSTLATYGMEPVTDWMAQTFSGIVWHEDFEEMMHALGVIRLGLS